MPATYYIVPITDDAVTAEDFHTACEEARYRAEADGILYALVQDDNAVFFHPPSVAELADAWGIPGVDSPATL